MNFCKRIQQVGVRQACKMYFLHTQAYWEYRFLNKKSYQCYRNFTNARHFITVSVVSYRFSNEQAGGVLGCFLMLSKGILLSFFCVYTRSCKQLSALLLHKYDVYQNKIRGESQWEIILIGNYP
mgnify:CR=1 FL=1